MTQKSELERIAEEASACTRCRLAGGRTKVVFGMGDPNADLMFVGEGPGEQEDLQGLPFVGRSGQLLDRLMLEEIGITRDNCYIGNVVKCLRHSVLVKLGDGSWEKIGRLVNRRYSGDVMSVDGEGRLVKRRVVGWYASPLAGRRVFRMWFPSAKLSPRGAWGVTVLTGDHEVLTEQGWVPVASLQPGTPVATGEAISAVARDVVLGTLLAGGSVGAERAHLGAERAYPSLSPSGWRQDYALFKCALLRELHAVIETARSTRAMSPASPEAHPVVMVRAASERCLSTLAFAFHGGAGGHKKVPDWVGTALNERSLAIWFLDGGHIGAGQSRVPVAEMATCASDDRSLEVLLKGLDQLGIAARARPRRIHFDPQSTERLSKVIAPYVPPSMRYKLPPDISSSFPYAAKLWQVGPPEVLYDEPIVEEIAHNGTDETFFCIDVEETHNFVTAGGVVHNCRPPGNRDPEPDEIEACRPYLEAQLRLIGPKVVVTLGNFATRTLLGTNEPISRLRGRVYPYRSGYLVPTFHPSAALRGSPVVIAQMRADLVRAKEALRQAQGASEDG